MIGQTVSHYRIVEKLGRADKIADWRAISVTAPCPSGSSAQHCSSLPPAGPSAQARHSRSGLYYSTTRPRGHGSEYTIQYLDFGSGRTTEVFRQSGSLHHQWLAVSPDEEWILYGEDDEPRSELMLVENFR